MDSNGLGKLLPKRRRKKGTEEEGSDDAASLRRTSMASREATESDDSNSQSRRSSYRDEEQSNFASFDFNHGGDPRAAISRPTAISPHPSQIGYLTTSSPLVQASHIQEVRPSRDSRRSTLTSSTKTTAFPSFSDDTLDPAPPLTKSATALVPPKSSGRRSPSPVGRFRDKFRSKPNPSSSGSSSPERRPQTAPGKVPQEPSGFANFPPVPDFKLIRDEPPQEIPEIKEPDTVKPAAPPPPSGRLRALSRGQRINTAAPPRTPPDTEIDASTPVIVNTPPTPTNSQHSTFESRPEPKSVPSVGTSPGTSNAASPAVMTSPRKSRAGSVTLGPSKLSNITLPPLTPTPENVPSTPSSGSGFFSSVISAAQNVTNTLSNFNANLAQSGGKGRSVSQKDLPIQEEDQAESGTGTEAEVEVELPAETASGQSAGSKEPAVKTLGMGDLSLSHLGIMEQSTPDATPIPARVKESDSRVRSESAPAPVDAVPHTVVLDQDTDDSQTSTRPRSLNEASVAGDRSPLTGSIYEDKVGVQPGTQRTGSIRSAIGRHRKRGSSAATGGTGTTIGAAIATANASVARPASGDAPKIATGFAVASKKRNRDFHALFKSVPDDDYLIEDYSCALQREILAHGRLYVSEGHLCFSSNILGWSTTLVMSFDEIVSVEKRNTALLFKNGLMISTLHAKHVFASFTSRDSTYDLIVRIWKLGHASLRSSLNGVHLDETGGDKTEKIDADSTGSQSATVSEVGTEDGEDIYDEDEDEDEAHEATQAAEPDVADTDSEKAVARKASGVVATNGVSEEKPKAGSSPTPGDDFPGPASHAATDCGDADTHYDRVVGDDIVPAPLGKVYSLIFGPASVTWMSKWLSNEQKCMDLQMEDKKGLTVDNKSRTYSYIKPLNASIGPRQTKCIVTEQVENIDLDKAVNILCTTQNPDVPSGNVFSVKTKYCLSWAENNSTRVQINCTVEWTGKSWLKGPIEKGANDGQAQYCKELFTSLKAAVSSKARPVTAPNGAVKGKKKGRKSKSAQAVGPTSEDEGISKAAVKQTWGALEPLHEVIGPIVDIIKPLMTGNVVYGLLVGLLVATWFGFGINYQRPGRYPNELGGFLSYPDRVAAYDEMWRREESELWEWLEERVGMERLHQDGAGGVGMHKKQPSVPRTVEEKLREDRMDEREISEAIRVTEEKLNVLKAVVAKNQRQQPQSQPQQQQQQQQE